MTDQQLHSFEQRVAAGLERYVAGAWDPKPASDIADRAMRPHGLVQRTTNATRSRRLLLLGLAAVLMVPAVYIGARTLQPPQMNVVNPQPTLVPAQPPEGHQAILVRRVESPGPGLAIVAARADGFEAVLRFVPDSAEDGARPWDEWARLSPDGWIALGQCCVGPPWPLTLLDLSDPQSAPWVIDEANIGGIGPRLGPNGLLAAPAASAEDPSTMDRALVIVDLVERTLSRMPLTGTLVGGGPSILWTEDGGILQSTESEGEYIVGYPDGRTSRELTAGLYDGSPYWGRDGSSLRVCETTAYCLPSSVVGSVERVAFDGTAATVYEGGRSDRVYGAWFGLREGEYWLLFDHNGGRQYVLARLDETGLRDVATIDRASDWTNASVQRIAPDGSSVATFVITGADNQPAVVLTPTADDRTSSYHTGFFAGYLEAGVTSNLPFGVFERPAETMPPGGATYQLPTVEELIDAEIQMNPGREVMGQATHDAVPGDIELHEYSLTSSRPGSVEAYLDCYGPSSVTVRAGTSETTSPCSRAGAYVLSATLSPEEPVTVIAAGDTSWRVVLYEGY